MPENLTRHQSTQASNWEQEMKEFFHQMFPQETNTTATQNDFADYLGIFRRRKWFIIASLFIVPFLAVFLFSLEKPMYEATATLLIEPVNPKIVQFEEVVGPDRSSDYYLTQYKLLQSRSMAEIVIDTLESKSNLQGEKLGKSDMSTIQEGTMQQSEETDSDGLVSKNIVDDMVIFSMKILQDVKGMAGLKNDPLLLEPSEIIRHNKIKNLMRATRIEPVSGTRLVNVTIRGLDPYDITVKVNTLAEAFVAQNLENKLNASKQASEWLKNEVSNLQEEMHRAELALIDFIEKRGFTPQGEAQNSGGNDRHDEELKANLLSTKTQRLKLENRLMELKRLVELFRKQQRPPLVSEVDIPGITRFQEQYLNIESEYQALSEKFTSSHPKVVDLILTMGHIREKMISLIEDQIEKTHNEMSFLIDKENSLSNVLTEEKSEKVVSYRDKIMYETFMRDMENKRGLYQTVLKRLSETEVTKGLETNNIIISQKAVATMEPMPSKKKKIVAGSLMFALAIGMGLAFITDKLDKRFHSPDQAEQHMKIPLLGIIPRNRAKNINFQYEFMNPGRSYLDFPNAYRQLRTNIQFHTAPREIRTLVVTSTVRGEGKSTTVTNLGLSFAQLGKSVLLVDADLRHPTLHNNFDLSNYVGLSDILTRRAAWQQCIQHTAIENVKVIASGPRPPNPVELLSMKKMKTLCNELKDEFDLIIYDASALLGIPDACILGAEMDAVLLVHDSESVNKDMILEAKSNLEHAHANVLGIIFNNVKRTTYSSHHRLLNYNNDKSKTTGTNFYSTKMIENEKEQAVSININQAHFRDKAGDEILGEDLAFLELDLEIFNHSNAAFIFESSCAKVYLKQISKYGNVVSSLFNISNEPVDQIEDSVFSPHFLTNKLQNGLKDQEMVDSHETVIGKLIYKIPHDRRQYIFVYDGADFNINIPITL